MPKASPSSSWKLSPRTSPPVGKEQARKYARLLNCRFVILSNGNLHYFWDLERGNPYIITAFPNCDSVTGYKQVTPNPQRLVEGNRELIARFEEKIQAALARIWREEEAEQA